MDEKKLIYALLCAAVVTINFNLAAISAVIPTISREFGLSEVVVSQIITFYMLPYGIAALLYAPMTKFISYKKALIFSLGLYLASCLWCAMTRSFTSLLIGSVIMGVGAAGIIPLGLMIIGELFDKSIRGRMVGGFFSSAFFASLVGIIMIGFCPWRFLFWFPVVIGSAVIVMLFILKLNAIQCRHQASINYLRIIHEPRLREVFIFIFWMSFLYHGVSKWYGVYLSLEYHLSQTIISVFYIVTALSGIGGQTIGGWITDKKGRKAACVLGIVLLGFSTMLLIGKYPLIILACVLSLFAIGWTINHNGTSTVLTDFPNDDRPIVAGLNSSIRFVSGGLGFFLSSFLVQKSFGITFLIFGLLMFGGLIFVNQVVEE